MVSPPHFDHEKLDVYQLELKFLSWVTQFLADLSSRSLALSRELREQLDRASPSALLKELLLWIEFKPGKEMFFFAQPSLLGIPFAHSVPLW